MELLSPAGSKEALIAAVQSGADAVYLGGYKFSARHSAKNFSAEDMKKAIDYCHIRGTDVHVAANILVKEKEKEEFLDYIEALNSLGADAVIIQDIGMAKEVRKRFPDLPIHASTQITAASLDAVKFLEEMGFSRVVLSRELSMEEIKNITKQAKAEIEIFVHGALCMCYSGQCLMSSLIGSRSGNRGMCAQPCRLFYDLVENGNVKKSGYLLSPKDNALIDELETLDKIGVKSLKIEGRLKRPEYVAAVTGVYKKVITGFNVEKKDWDTLYNAFSRSGFTKGYFEAKTGAHMMSINTPGNVSDNTFDKEIIRKTKEETEDKKIPVFIYYSLLNDSEFELTITDDKLNSVTIKGDEKSQIAQTKPISDERIVEQLSKLGGTPFYAISIEGYKEEGITISVSEINNTRRKAIEKLKEKRCEIENRAQNKEDVCEEEQFVINSPRLSAEVRTMEQAEAVLKFDIPTIYAPTELVEKIKKVAEDRKVITIAEPVMRDKKKVALTIKDGVLVQNIGQLRKYKDYDCYGGMRLNVYNSNTIRAFKNLKRVEASIELNMRELNQLKPYTELEAMVYGRIPLMVMENCPKKSYASCGGEMTLRDRMKEEFPLVCATGCYSELLNSKPLYMADKLEDMKALPISVYRLKFTTETKKECEKIISAYEDAIKGTKEPLKMQDNTFTRGHYYRGVE